MKTVKCPICSREKEVKNNVILAICPGCQVEMKPLLVKRNKTRTKHL